MRKTSSLILILLTITFSSCLRSKSNNDAHLNFPLSSEVDTLDPVNSYDAVSANVVYQGYEQLFEYHYLQRPFKLVPLLAEEMPKIEDDGKKYVIKIKQGIEYHPDICFNGKKRFVVADDFINQIKRLAFKPLRSNGWWLFDGRIKGINEFREKAGSDYEKMKSENISGLYATNDHTLVIELTEPYPQMINALAMSFTSPTPIEALDYYKNDLKQNMIGTGPYRLTNWTKQSKVQLEKFKSYHKAFYPGTGDRRAHGKKLLVDAGKRIPFIEKVTFHINKEAQTRWLQFLSGNLDFLRIPKDNYSSVITPEGVVNSEFQKKNISVDVFTTLTFWWIAFNMSDKILGENYKLRQAIAHAIDTRRYIETFTNNIGLKANSIYPPGIPGYDPTTNVPFAYDIEKAKTLLAEAGYPNGKGLPELVYDTRNSSTTQRQRAEFFKGELAKIGIKLKIQMNTFPGYLKKARDGKLQIWLDGWTLDYPDSENVLQLLTTKNAPPGPNASYFSDEEFDTLFNKLKIMENKPEKFQLMKKMEQIIQDKLPWVLLHYERDYYAIHNRLKNFRYSDLMANKIKYLRLGK